MSAGHSQHTATSSVRRAERAAAEERKLAAAATAAAAARASRLAAAELAAARAEVEAAAAAEEARAAAAEAEALCGSTNSSVSADGSADADHHDAARERAAQWAAEHARAPRDGAPRGGARGGGGWDDQDRGLYGVRTVVRDAGPGVGWPTLTKTNYVEWAAIMRIRLQVRHMWEAVQDGDVDHHEDRRALDALIAAVPPEMQFSLSNKRTAKEAWDAIAAARIGSDRARKSTLQALRKEWENLAFKPGEDVDDFALRLNTLLQKMVQFGDDTYDEERAVEKLFRCIPEKYKQMARSIESLLDLSTMTIEEAIGRLKVVDTDEPQSSSGPITTGGKLLLTREQWDAGHGDRKGGESSSSAGGRKRGKPRKARKDVQARAPGRAEGAARGGARDGAAGRPKPAQDDACHNCGRLGHWAKECRQPRRGQAHVAQAEEEEPALFMTHASIELPPAAPTAAAPLHLDEPKAHALLGDGSGSDKTGGWCLDTGATHHMTGQREHFAELDSNVRGSVKFGDASAVEIKGVGSVIFIAKTGEHRLLTGVYYIPALRNSIISLGQLDENGSRVLIEDGVLRIWDRHRRLLAKVTRGANRLYVLDVQVAQPLCLAARRDDEAWQWHERFGHLHFEAAGGVGSSSSPSTSTSAPTSSSTPVVATPPAPQPATPRTPAPAATSPGTSTSAHVEHSPVEFASPLSHDGERIDAYHDGEPLRYRTMENLLGDQPVPGQVPRDLEAQLQLARDASEPQSFAEAERDAAWRAAMQLEMDAVEQNRTWELADLPHGHRAITLKWVFKLKRDEAGAIVKHKARLVARGFLQQEGVDFDDAFAPVARMESVRLLLALAAQEGWRVHHMDIKSAFLNGDLKEEVYVQQPPGFAIPGQEGRVLRLRKALYGLRQAPRAWNAKLDSTLKMMGFEQSPHEAAVYRRGSGGTALLVGVYVDDLVITGTKDAGVAAFKEEMKAAFQMSDLGLLSFYLGIEVHQDHSGTTLRQTAYAKRIVELAGLTDCNPALTPMEERLKLSRDSTAEEVDATQYRRLVGSLRYLAHTRPDLAFSVGYVSRFMERPTTEHQQAVKRIIRYVAGTLDHGLHYPRSPGAADFVGYSDSDHAGDIDTSKSTSGILFFLGKCLVSWQSVKQQVVAMSSCEAEYIAASTACTQALWLARLLGDLLGRDTRAVQLMVDSKSALALAKNPVFHERSKHIRLRHHFIRGCLEEGSIKASYINTTDQLADLLTKPLGRIKFRELCSRIGMVQSSHKTTHKT